MIPRCCDIKNSAIIPGIFLWILILFSTNHLLNLCLREIADFMDFRGILRKLNFPDISKFRGIRELFRIFQILFFIQLHDRIQLSRSRDMKLYANFAKFPNVANFAISTNFRADFCNFYIQIHNKNQLSWICDNYNSMIFANVAESALSRGIRELHGN